MFFIGSRAQKVGQLAKLSYLWMAQKRNASPIK